MNWTSLVLLFEARNLRERILIGATVMSLVWLLWLVTVDTAVVESKVEVTTSINQLAQQLAAGTASQRQEIQTWPERLNLAEQKTAAELALQLTQDQVEDLIANAMDPQEVARLLQTLLAAYRGIELIGLQNLPAIEIVVAEQSTGLYRHPLALTINGNYFEIIAYLEALEALRSGLTFRKFSYQVVDYPSAEVTLQVESISPRKAWFGG